MNLDKRVNLDEGCELVPRNFQDQEEDKVLIGAMDNELNVIVTPNGEVD